ncbi:MAG: preprotein translocase subunit SecE [Oscillospiraceae bacterium]
MAEKTKKKKSFFSGIKRFFGNIAKYFRDTVSEMKKVVWPSKTQIINNTIVVIVIVTIAAVVIFGLDAIFGFTLKALLKLA